MTEPETKEPQEPVEPQAQQGALPNRLSGEDEARAIEEIKASLLGSKDEFAAGMERVFGMSWAVGVRAIAAIWPEAKVTLKRAILKRVQEAAIQDIRFGLSLARGLHPVDAENAGKLLLALAKIIVAEPLTPRKLAFNGVLIGRGKPWLFHFDVAGWKPADQAVLAQSALACAFPAGLPPQTHVNLIKWASDKTKIEKLPPESLAAIAETFRRWSRSLRERAKKELGELPPPLMEALEIKPAEQVSPEKRERVEGAEGTEPDGRPERPERTERGRRDKEGPKPALEAGKREPVREVLQEVLREVGAGSRAGREGGAVAGGRGASDPVGMLRQVADEISRMQRELERARQTVRSRDEEIRRLKEGGKGRDREGAGADVSESRSQAGGEWKKRSEQLEVLVAELRNQLEDLAGHHEDVAVSMRAHTDSPETDGAEQLRALIGLKLAREHSDFGLLRMEPEDEVVRQHYRSMLEQVFGVLGQLGVIFPEPEEGGEG